MSVLTTKSVYTKGPSTEGKPGEIGDKIYTTLTQESSGQCFCLVQYPTKDPSSGQSIIVSELYADSSCGVGMGGMCNTLGNPLLRIVLSFQQDIMLIIDLKACSTYEDYMEYCSMHDIEPIGLLQYEKLAEICQIPVLFALMFGVEQMKYLTYWAKELPSLEIDHEILSAFENDNKTTDKQSEAYSSIAASMRKIFYSYYTKALSEATA